MKDLYSLLQVSKNANQKDIKQSYRKLAFSCHPDKNKSPHAQKQFQEISEAYEILSDPKKRDLFDKFGYDCIHESSAPPINPLDLFQSLFNVDFGGHVDTNVFFFSDLSPFGMLHEPPQNSLIYILETTLDELYTGTQKEFSIQSKDKHGSYKETKYVLNLKPGTKDKEHLVVAGSGHYNPRTTQHDDLIVKVKEVDHPLYKRQGNDLLRTHTISLCDALCGPKIHLDHFGESLEIEIHTIVKPNSLYQVFGKGMPIKQTKTPALSDSSASTDRDRGDLILDLHIQFPEYLSDKRKEYLTKILGKEETLETETLETETPETPETHGTSMQAYYYKDKQEVMKELLDDEEESSGCLQQ